MKTLLILMDGMRPDAITNLPAAQRIIEKSSYTMTAQTVMPSVTLPCHMSLFHSVDPARHGTTTNMYAPQVRPIKGLCEVLAKQKKRCAFFYDWEELRDLSRPDSLTFSYFCKGKDFGFDVTNDMVADAAIAYLQKYDADFIFLYQGYSDVAGHRYGWMSKEYLQAVESGWANIERVISVLPEEEYTVIIMADHGGHDRMHGTDLPEDMTIPLIIMGKDFPAGKQIENANIQDIAPTVAKLLDVPADEDWDGRSLL